MTLTDRLRNLTSAPLNRCALVVARFGIQPDWITVFGLLLVALASLFIARGEFLAGGLLLLLSLPLDALDGAVARALNRTGAFGMALDSTLDRYADAFIFAAIGYYFADAGRLDMLAAALAAMMGSFMVSYVRARAADGNPNKVATELWQRKLVGKINSSLGRPYRGRRNELRLNWMGRFDFCNCQHR